MKNNKKKVNHKMNDKEMRKVSGGAVFGPKPVKPHSPQTPTPKKPHKPRPIAGSK